MATVYPAQIDNSITLPPVSELNPINAASVNDLRAAIIAIEQALGLNPGSIYGNASARMANIEAILNAGGGGGGGGVVFSNDLSGSLTFQTVVGLQGRPVANIAPSTGYVLTWTGLVWEPEPAPGSTVIFSNDLSGSTTSQTVVGLQGRPLSSAAPTAGEPLLWNGTDWAPGTNFENQSLYTTGQVVSGPALSTSLTSGLLSLTGKLIVNGISTASFSDTGQGIIYFDSVSNQFLVSQNGADYVPLLFGGSGIVGGDLTGTLPDPTIAKLQGNTVSAASPTTGQALTYNGSAWVPGSPSPSGAAGGDLTGVYPNPTIDTVQGHAVDTLGGTLKIEWFSPSTVDLGLAIQAAHNALPTTYGGTIDARGIKGAYTWHTTVNVNRPFKLLLDSIQITSTVQSMFEVQDNFTLTGTDNYATQIFPQADGYVITFINPTNHVPFGEATYGTSTFILERLYVFGGATAVNTTGFVGNQEADIIVQDCTFNSMTYFALIFNSSFYYSRVLRCMFEFNYGSALVYDDTETLFRDNIHAVAATGAQNILLINPDFVNIENDRFFGEPPNVYPDIEIQVEDSFSWTAGYVTINKCQFRAEREQWLNSQRVRIRTSSTTNTAALNGSVNTNIDGCWFLGPNALQITSIGRSSNVVTATLSTAWPSGHGLQVGDQIQVLTGMTDSSFLGTFTVSAVGTPSESQTVSWNQVGATSSQSNKDGFLNSLETAAIRFEAPIGRYNVVNNNFEGYAFAIDDGYTMVLTAGNGAVERDISDRSIFENNRMIGSVGYQCQEFKLGGRFFNKAEMGENSPLQSFNAAVNNKEQLLLQNRILNSETQSAWDVLGACSVAMGATDPYGTTRAAHVSRTGTTQFVDSGGDVTEGIQSAGLTLTSLGTLSYIKFWAKGSSTTPLASINVLSLVASVAQQILYRTISLSTNWKQYKIPIVWPANTTSAFVGFAPGDVDAMVADCYVFGFQVSDTDCDYWPTTGSYFDSTTLGSRFQLPVVSSGLDITDVSSIISPDLPIFGGTACTYLSSINHQTSPTIPVGAYDTAFRIDMATDGGGSWDVSDTITGSSNMWMTHIAGNQGTHELISAYMQGLGIGDSLPFSIGNDTFGGSCPSEGSSSVGIPEASNIGEFDWAEGAARYTTFTGSVPTEAAGVASIFRATVASSPGTGATTIPYTVVANGGLIGCRYILNHNHSTTTGHVSAITVDTVNQRSTITFVGTSWTSNDIGRFLKIGSNQDFYTVTNYNQLLGDDIYLNGFGIGHWYQIQAVNSGTQVVVNGEWDTVAFAISYAMLPTAPYIVMDGANISSFTSSTFTIPANTYTWAASDTLYSPPHHYQGVNGINLIMQKLFKTSVNVINGMDGIKISSRGYSPLGYGLHLTGLQDGYGGFNTGIKMEAFTGNIGIDMLDAGFSQAYILIPQDGLIVMDSSTNYPSMRGLATEGIQIQGKPGQASLFLTDGVNSDLLVNHPSSGVMEFEDATTDIWLVQDQTSFVKLGPGAGAGNQSLTVDTSKARLLRGTQFGLTPISANYNVKTTDFYIAVQTLSAGITVTMPLTSAGAPGDTYVIKDTAGTANTHNITISGNGINIDGAATLVLNNSYQSVMLGYDNNSNQWISASTSGAGGGGGGGSTTGPASVRPSATGSGKTYYCTDVPVMYVDDPTALAWKQFVQGQYAPAPPAISSYNAVGNIALINEADVIRASLYTNSASTTPCALVAGSLGPTATWMVTFTAAMGVTPITSNTEMGVCVADGLTGSNTAYGISYWTNSTNNTFGMYQVNFSVGAARITANNILAGQNVSLLRFRLLNDGTNLHFQVSYQDGFHWQDQYCIASPIVSYYGFYMGETSSGQSWCQALIYENNLTAITTAQVAITGATFATPIVITAVGHNFKNGDLVAVHGVGGNTAANSGTSVTGQGVNYSAWPIQVLSSSTFSLVGSVGNAAYTSGGNATLVGR